MRKIIPVVLLVALTCTLLTGCIQWQTKAEYTLLQDVSNIKSIRVYQDSMDTFSEENGRMYNYSDPNEPCGTLLGEIPADQYAVFTAELTGLSFVEHHIIFLVPVAYDPNFYYGDTIIKIEYYDGSCELISCFIQRQFSINEKYPDTTWYDTEDDAWDAFLQNWVDLPN